MRGSRKNLHVRLSPEAFAGIQDAADRLGVDVNDLVEAWGLELQTWEHPESEHGRAMVRRAREIWTAKKRRGRG